MKKILFLIILIPLVSLGQVKEKTLKDISTFPIGSSIRITPFLKDSKLVSIQKKHFNSFTSGSDMKMYNIIKAENEYNWEVVDTILKYATQNNQRLFGHNLIWHSSTPKWVVEKARENPKWLQSFMKSYIETYVGRYKGKVHGWDVVNEGLESAGSSFRKESIWFEIMGKSYIEKAFIYARKADPDAILFYNDFNIERDTLKLNATLKMVEDFKKRGIPIDGIGFQMHIRMDIPNEIIEFTLKKAAKTGLQIHLSEVDLIFNTHDDTRGGGIEKYKFLTEKMKQDQAKKYYDLAQIYKSVVPKNQQYGITFWGFNDRDTWIKPFFDMEDWPCIFDNKLNKKPAFDGFYEGLVE